MHHAPCKWCLFVCLLFSLNWYILTLNNRSTEFCFPFNGQTHERFYCHWPSFVFCNYYQFSNPWYDYFTTRRKRNLSSYFKRVHNRFGGMRDLANFCGDIRDGSWKQEREAGISFESGSGIWVFEESGCENRKGKVAGYGILIFTRLHDLTGAGWYKWIVCEWSVSAFKWCIDQGIMSALVLISERGIRHMSCCISWPCLRS